MYIYMYIYIYIYYIYMYIYIHIYIYIYTDFEFLFENVAQYIKTIRHLFKINHISILPNLQRTFANKKYKIAYTIRIITR